MISIIPASNAPSINLRGQKGMTNCLTILTSMCNNYVNSTYAASARTIGFTNINADLAIIEANSGLIDGTIIVSIGAEADPSHGMAHKYITTFSHASWIGTVVLYRIVYGDETEFTGGGKVNPVVTLKSTAHITGGSGTSTSPYTLGI